LGRFVDMWVILWIFCEKVFLDRGVGILYLKCDIFLLIALFSMISSMTGYGRAEVTLNRITALAEVRSINSRHLEVFSRLPRTLSQRENDVKELVRTKFVRGKISVAITVVQENDNDLPLKINTSAVKAYVKLLTGLRKTIKSREKISLEHLLKFPEVLEFNEGEERDEKQWDVAQKALAAAMDAAGEMRLREGNELKNDITGRIRQIEESLTGIEETAARRVGEEKVRLHQRVKELVSDVSIVDNNRLELEIALLADRLDVTEECVRFRSHNKFFLHGLTNEDAAGRKLNFLIQEMNREANTIGSKANNAEIAHMVVAIKEELEKIREQLQNIE